MPYTLLLATDTGVVLYDYHAVRLNASPDSDAGALFCRFARECAPGVWAISTDDTGKIEATRRPGSRMYDTMPTRALPSPALGTRGPFPKPRSPGFYDEVRLQGTATLLTSADGNEIYEACSAAVVSWDGERIVCVPQNRPRVWSTTEAAIRDHFPVREAPISTRSNALLLVNAVKGTCTLAEPYSLEFPAEIRQKIEQLLMHLTKHPTL